MSEANFNLVLHPEARFAAEDFHDRLKIPFIELTRLYQIDKIGSQYRAFGKVLGVTFDDQAAAESAQKWQWMPLRRSIRRPLLRSGNV